MWYIKKSIIGKEYRPCDNSYAVNITSASDYPYLNDNKYLAGTALELPKKCIIVSEPFNCIINVFGRRKVIPMILVQYDKSTHAVLYYKNCIE